MKTLALRTIAALCILMSQQGCLVYVGDARLKDSGLMLDPFGTIQKPEQPAKIVETTEVQK